MSCTECGHPFDPANPRCACAPGAHESRLRALRPLWMSVAALAAAATAWMLLFGTRLS
jgi:hypothetical protein